MKNIFIGVTLTLASIMSFIVITPSSASADCGQRLLTFPTWYRGLVVANGDSCDFKKPTGEGGFGGFIATILLNILEIAIQAVAYISLGYILWGSYTYIRTVSNSNNVTRARKMIQNAVIGLIISLISVLLISFVIGRIAP